MAETPFMSAYLSAANRVAKTARGKATNEARIETAGDKHDQRLSERLDPHAHPQTHAALSNDSRRGRLDAGRCIRDLRTNADPTDHPCSC